MSLMAGPIISDDGQWVWNGEEWIRRTPPAQSVPPSFVPPTQNVEKRRQSEIEIKAKIGRKEFTIALWIIFLIFLISAVGDWNDYFDLLENYNEVCTDENYRDDIWGFIEATCEAAEDELSDNLFDAGIKTVSSVIVGFFAYGRRQ